MAVDDAKIREVAHRIWEQNGRPEGKDDDFWFAAQKLLADEGEITEPDVVDETVPVAPAAAILSKK